MKKLKFVHIAALMAFIFISFLSVLRFVSFNAAMLDIGNMSQAIWSATQGEKLLVSSPSGTFSRLNGHSEYIYFLIALIYKVVPSPITLLIVQALLYSSAIYPVYHLAYQRLQSHKKALRIGLIYLIYPVAVTAVLFDFHGDTLAMPLILFAIYYFYKKDIIKFSLFVLLSLACKIYVVIPISVFGLILFFKNKKREALITFILSAIWIGFVFFVRHRISGEGILVEASSQVTGYAKGYFTEIFDKAAVTNVADRVVHLIIVILPALFLGYKSLIWMAPGLIITFSVLLSSGPGPSYDYRFHHYALAVPFFILSIIEGASKFSKKGTSQGNKNNFLKPNLQNNLRLTFIMAILFNLGFVQTPLSFRFYTSPYLGSNEVPVFSFEPRDRIKRKIVSNIVPPQKGVLADIFIAPHMTNRENVYSTFYTDEEKGVLTDLQKNEIFDRVEYIVIDVFSVYFHAGTLRRVMNADEFSLIFSQDGLLIFSKGKKGMEHDYHIKNTNKNTWNKNKKPITLMDSSVEQINENTFSFDYKWYLIREPEKMESMIAITHLEGVKQSRVIHLSSLMAVQSKDWRRGRILVESFTAEFPDYVSQGKYNIITTFYDSSHPGFIELSKESRISEGFNIGSLSIK